MVVEKDKCVFYWKTGEALTIHYNCCSLLPVLQGYNKNSKQAACNTVESANMCVIDEGNQNLTENQKELLKWHFKLGYMGLD